jgi:hypothetical protein
VRDRKRETAKARQRSHDPCQSWTIARPSTAKQAGRQAVFLRLVTRAGEAVSRTSVRTYAPRQ